VSNPLVPVLSGFREPVGRGFVVVSFGNTNTAPNTLIENNKIVVLVKEVFPETGVQELFLVEKTFQKAVLKTHFSTESEGWS